MRRRPPSVLVDLPDGVDPAFARSVRFWSRAYPRRWRAARGEELLGLLADLAAPRARRLDVRSALDLVRSGWSTRLRERPPSGPWLRYRLFSTRSLPDHRAWVADDIAGLLFPLRERLVNFVVPVTIVATQSWEGAPLTGQALMALLVAACVLGEVFFGGHTRTQAREAHLVPRPGERITPGSWVRLVAPRRRVMARVGLPWAAGAVVTVLAVCAVAWARAPQMLQFTSGGAGATLGAWSRGEVPRTPLLAALALAVSGGAVLAWAVRRRLQRIGRRPDDLPQQPHRVLVGLGVRNVLRVVLGVVLLAALPVTEGLGAMPLALSLPVGIAAGVLAPPAVAAWWVVRTTPGRDALAFRDVWRVALLGREPLVDPAASELMPVLPSEVGAVWPWPWSNETPTPALG